MVVKNELSRGQLRRRAILDAATILFLEKGFDRTSLSDILSHSKGSRSTLYDQFGSKEGLLKAMIEEVVTHIWHELDHQEGASLALTQEALFELGRRFACAALTPQAIAVFRILMAGGGLLPRETARDFFNNGPSLVQKAMRRKLREILGDRFGLDEAALTGLAKSFMGAVLGDMHFRCVLGLVSSFSQKEIDAQVRVGVSLFLNGIYGVLPA